MTKANPYQYATIWECGPHRPYNVDIWGSHPCDGNDDCHAGESILTRDEAIARFNEIKEAMERGDARVGGQGSIRSWGVNLREVAYVIADGHDLDMEFRNPNFDPEPDYDDGWHQEQAMQAGMAFGCDGYNDMMGY